MKKWIVTVAVLALTASVLAGCGNSEAGADNTESAAVENADNNESEESAAVEYGEEAYVDAIEVANYVTLGEYKGLTAVAAAPEVTDEDLESYIEYVLSSNMVSTEVTDRAVQEGDIANIDYEGKKDGVAFDGGTAAGYDLEIGSNSFIDGFEDGLIGVEIGETVDLNLTFPESYPSEDLAGQEVVFTVTVNSIRVESLPVLDDEFVQGLGMGLNTVDEFRQNCYDVLMEEAEYNYTSSVQSQLLEQVLSNAIVSEELPEELLTRYSDRLYANMEYYANMYGMDVESFMSATGSTEETLRESANAAAGQILVMRAIADAEGLVPTEEEINAELEESAALYGYEDLEEYKNAIDFPAFGEYVMTEKVTAFLMENGNVSETAAEYLCAAATWRRKRGKNGTYKCKRLIP